MRVVALLLAARAANTLHIIGAGRGNSGTGTLHQAMCYMCIRSQQYLSSYNFPGQPANKMQNNMDVMRQSN